MIDREVQLNFLAGYVRGMGGKSALYYTGARIFNGLKFGEKIVNMNYNGNGKLIISEENSRETDVIDLDRIVLISENPNIFFTTEILEALKKFQRLVDSSDLES